MEKNKKVKNVPKSRINKKQKLLILYILVGITAIYFIYSIIRLIQQPTETFVVENGKISEEESAVGYLIREEVVLQGNNYKNGMVQIKADGDKVAKGDPVFRYYSNNEENLVKKIQELDIKIQDAMENEGDILPNDVKRLETQIEEKLLNIRYINDVQKIEEYKKEISDIITKKAKIVGELSPAGSYIRKLIDERSGYENTLNSGAEYITAPESGIISYRVDGLENVLTVSSFSTLSTKFLEDLNLKAGESIPTSSENGKIINNFVGYIATTLESDRAKEAEIGKTVTLRLSNGSEIQGSIEYIVEEDDERLIIFKITNELELLSRYRKITFDVIWWSYSGLKVPNTSIIEEDGRKGSKKEEEKVYYVVRNRAGYTDKIPIKVLKQNSSYSIITNYESTELKTDLGYSDEEAKNTKTIVLYDEILDNPK